MIKRIKRWFKNEPNSRLTTLHENRHDTCMFLRNWGNSVFCKTGRRLFYSHNYTYCMDSCMFYDSMPGNANLTKLLADLEQIHEQAKYTN